MDSQLMSSRLMFALYLHLMCVFIEAEEGLMIYSHFYNTDTLIKAEYIHNINIMNL